MYTHELKQEIVRALSAIPQVRRLNHLQYWGEQNLYITVGTAETGVAALIDASLKRVMGEWHGLQPARLRWRILSPGEAPPASAVLWERNA